MDCLSQNIFKLFSAVIGNPSQVYQNNEGSSSQGLGLLYFTQSHRVLVHDYSRPVKLQANNQEVPFDALTAKVKAMSLNLTSFDLQTYGKLSAPPAGSGNLSIGC